MEQLAGASRAGGNKREPAGGERSPSRSGGLKLNAPHHNGKYAGARFSYGSGPFDISASAGWQDVAGGKFKVTTLALRTTSALPR